jgi:hypothetical protein
MTKQAAEELSRSAQSDRAWQRDHAEEIWAANYDKLFPRPKDAENVTQPGA